MINEVQWLSSGVDFPEISTERLERWIGKVAANHNRIVGPLAYIFCNDDKIIEVNRRFLSHDYYTDIITFDYSRGRMISGDMYISLDTVRTNADMLNQPYSLELHRVIIHGVLHLCGINDKGPGEREVMEQAENEALAILKNEI